MSRKPSILIVEDESGIADTLQYVLATDGFAPVWACTAEEAIRLFAAEPPALVVLDVGLPDLNGIALFRRARKTSSSKPRGSRGSAVRTFWDPSARRSPTQEF